MRWPSLVAVLWLPATWACGGDALPPPPPPPPPPRVAAVVVTPASADLTVGDTLRLRAEPRDSAGNPLAGRRVAWDAAAPTIASVDTAGLVRAAGPGATVVLAMSEGRAGVARLKVEPVPPPPPPPPPAVASVRITPDSAALVAGDRLQLDAEPRDSIGNLLQRPVAWVSADPAVATVDSAGLVRGVYPGRTQITATSESVADSAGVTVGVLACSEVDTTAAFAQEARQRFLVALRLGRPEEVLGYSPGRVYRTALNGFAAELTATEIATLRRDPRVRAIQPDGQASIQVDTVAHQATPDTQNVAVPWGLDRVDARRGLDGTYSWTADGRGVTAYIVDTGILEERTEFEGRASRGPFILPDSIRGDCHGHGTHVAGIVGSRTYGIAKRVRLVGVRVLNCQGFGWWSDIAAGLDWVAQQPLPAVANMSLGGPAGSAEDIMVIALRGLIASGVLVAVAAGNSGNDACTFTPARVAEAVTVAATYLNPTDSVDIRPWWSNFGECVDLFAPGLQIPSVSIADDDRALVASGTSMATPHVTGVAALILSAFPALSPAQVEAMILDATTRDAVLLAASPNRLLYTGLGLPSPPPDPPPPPPPPPPDIPTHVGGLAGTRDTLDRVGDGLVPRWQATVDVSAHTPAHEPLAGVTVTGLWGRLDQGAECVTGANGRCQLVSPPISCAIPSTGLAVTGLRGSQLVYDLRANDVPAEVRVVRP